MFEEVVKYSNFIIEYTMLRNLAQIVKDKKVIESLTAGDLHC